MLGSAARAWWDDDALRLGASLAYYTLFAIGPVLLVATAIAGMFFGADAVRGEIVGQLEGLIGRDGALTVQSLLEGASQRQAGVFATVIGTIAFIIAATGAFLELQVALNTIWRVKPKAAYPQGIDRRSVAVVRTGRGGRFPAAGLAGDHCGTCGIQRMDLAPCAWFPCRVERSACWYRSSSRRDSSRCCFDFCPTCVCCGRTW